MRLLIWSVCPAPRVLGAHAYSDANYLHVPQAPKFSDSNLTGKLAVVHGMNVFADFVSRRLVLWLTIM